MAKDNHMTDVILRRILDRAISVAMLANMIGTGFIFALVAILNADVVARGIFNAPIRGVVELVIFSLVLIVFLQLPDVVRSNRLTRSDGFLLLVNKRRPRLARNISRLIDAAAALFMCLIAWTIWPEFLESFASCHFFTPPEFGPAPTGNFYTDMVAGFARCEYSGTPGIFTAPLWPVKMVIAFSVTLCAIIFAFKALLGPRGDKLFDSHEDAS
jgi:TRAP-type C4-dicarboxylate transport system permease small subunit